MFRKELSDRVQLNSQTLHVTLIGNQVEVEVQIQATYLTILNFTFLTHPYTFQISKWRARGQAKFYTLFHEKVRNQNEFGCILDDGSVQKTQQQKINTVIQAVREFFHCLDQILRAHQRSVIDYAVWYRERPMADENYSTYITLLVCHCIVHTNFMYPSATYELVEYYHA